MDNLRATRQPIGQGGGNKVEGMESDSLWEGEGTSDSLSSEAPTGPTTAVSKSKLHLSNLQVVYLESHRAPQLLQHRQETYWT